MKPANGKKLPIEVLVKTGKTHIGAEEIKARREAEVTMGTANFTAPAEVKGNPEAFKKWKEVTKIYQDAGLLVVSSTDNGVIGRYCMIYSEYLDLLKVRSELSGFELPEKMATDFDELARDALDKKADFVFRLIQYTFSVQAILKVDTAINTKLKTLLDLEDRIFLNPAAKVRGLPVKTKEKKKDKIADLGFDV